MNLVKKGPLHVLLKLFLGVFQDFKRLEACKIQKTKFFHHVNCVYRGPDIAGIQSEGILVTEERFIMLPGLFKNLTAPGPI